MTQDERIQVIQNELDDLNIKISALRKFLGGDVSVNIGKMQLILLQEQYKVMIKYSAILTQRIQDME